MSTWSQDEHHGRAACMISAQRVHRSVSPDFRISGRSAFRIVKAMHELQHVMLHHVLDRCQVRKDSLLHSRGYIGQISFLYLRAAILSLCTFVASVLTCRRAATDIPRVVSAGVAGPEPVAIRSLSSLISCMKRLRTTPGGSSAWKAISSIFKSPCAYCISCAPETANC